MVRLPTPTTSEVRWSFAVVFLCAVALTATISWGVVHKVNQSDQIVRVAVASADQVERLSAQLDAQAAQARAQAQTAQEQRAQLQQQNQLTQAQYRLTRAQLRALLAYLRSQGIAVPPTLFPALRPTRQERPTPKDPGAASSPTPHPSSSPSAPASPAPTTPTASPTPTAPRPPVVCTLLPLACH